MPCIDDIKTATRTIECEIRALREMENSYDETLSKVLDVLEECQGTVVVTGMGKSGHIARKIAATFASTGTPSFFLHPAEASHGDMGMLTEKDVVIAISNGGESRELSDVLLYSRRHHIPLIAMTKNPESTLAKHSDYLLKLPDAAEACPFGLAPTTSTTATLVMGDVLAVNLMERKSFSKTDYKERHPGGKLGAILKCVSDLMHKGDEMPIVGEDTPVQDALIEMTSKMLGCVGVVNDEGILTGMITDGDLRRWLSPTLFTEKVLNVMTKNPKTISPNALITEATYVMNNTGKGITNLFVVDEKCKPLGVIHIHDCLRAGAI